MPKIMHNLYIFMPIAIHFATIKSPQTWFGHNMLKQRIDWLDTLKLLGIFYIYVGHFGKSAGPLYPFVFSFHVPLFFFISGLFAKNIESAEDLFITLKKSFKQIVIPYFLFCIISLLYYLVRFQWSASTFIDSTINALMGVRGHVFAESLWFLPCLFMVIFYHALLSFALKNKWAVMAVSMAIFLWGMPKAIISNPKYFFNTDSALCYLSYYSIGYCASSLLSFTSIKEKSTTFRIICIPILISSLCVFAITYFKGFDYFFKHIKLVEAKVVIAFMLTCLLFVPNLFIAYILNNDTFASMGRSTIVFCGTEQKHSILSLISLVGLKLTFTNPMQTVMLSVFCLWISYFTICKAYNLYIK